MFKGNYGISRTCSREVRESLMCAYKIRSILIKGEILIMERTREGAAGWVHISRTLLPNNNHPIPAVGELIEIIGSRYLRRDKKSIKVPVGIYYVHSITNRLIVCTKTIENSQIMESFLISDFKNGLNVFNIIALEREDSIKSAQ